MRLVDAVKQDASEIYLLGDIFDYWFEYKTCGAEGFTRLLGKLAEVTDAGVEVHFFIGNQIYGSPITLQKMWNDSSFRALTTDIQGKDFFWRTAMAWEMNHGCYYRGKYFTIVSAQMLLCHTSPMDDSVGACLVEQQRENGGVQEYLGRSGNT